MTRLALSVAGLLWLVSQAAGQYYKSPFDKPDS